MGGKVQKMSRIRGKEALSDDEIEEFQSKQVAKNTVKGSESAVRNLFGKFGNLFAYVSNPI